MKKITYTGIRPSLKDIWWNAFMVRTCLKWDKYDIPFCPTLRIEVPKDLIIWTEAITIYNKEIKKNKDFKDDRYICFYLHDQFFDKLHGIWFDYNKAIEIIKHFGGIITPDFSTNIDFPQGLKFFNTYRMRAFGYWVSTFGINVINNVRWSHDTKAYCFNGIPRNSVVCLGTSASGLTVKRNREEYEDFLKLMVKKLNPKIILIYGSSNYSFFKELEEEGIIIKNYYHNWRKQEGI